MIELKQCKLRRNNIFTYRWISVNKAIEGEKVFYKDKEYIIEQVYFLIQSSKYLFNFIK